MIIIIIIIIIIIVIIIIIIGTPFPFDKEDGMKPLIALTGHISSYYHLMETTQDWCINEGVDSTTASKYVTSFYNSLSLLSYNSNNTLEELVVEAATPGGLNEQSMKYLTSTTNHYDNQRESLTAILNRLKGKK